MVLNQSQLKELVKAAVAEVLIDRRDFFKEIVEEVIEDIALSRAINEGMATDIVERHKIFAALET